MRIKRSNIVSSSLKIFPILPKYIIWLVATDWEHWPVPCTYPWRPASPYAALDSPPVSHRRAAAVRRTQSSGWLGLPTACLAPPPAKSGLPTRYWTQPAPLLASTAPTAAGAPPLHPHPTIVKLVDFPAVVNTVKTTCCDLSPIYFTNYSTTPHIRSLPLKSVLYFVLILRTVCSANSVPVLTGGLGLRFRQIKLDAITIYGFFSMYLIAS